MTATTETKLWICESCGFMYDPAIGDPDGGIPPGPPSKTSRATGSAPSAAPEPRLRPLEPGEA